MYEQSSAAAPSLNTFDPGYFVARVNGDAASAGNPTVSTPSTTFPGDLPLDDDVDHNEFSVPGSAEDVDGYFPAGNYTFTIANGATIAPLSFPTGSYPTAIPQISNFDAAQNVNPTNSFTLNFNAFTGAVAGDATELEIFNSDGTILFLKSVTSGTSITIPANTFAPGTGYDARLRFVHNVGSNTTSVPGVTGTSGYVHETSFNVSTSGTNGGGGNDTTPPTLAFSSPSNNQTGVDLTSPIVFGFSEPMSPQQAIQWQGVDPAKFSYTWQGGEALFATYAGGLPANVTVSYSLIGGATGFQDLAGNALATTQGSFSTGAGGGTTGGSTGGTGADPCRTQTQTPSGYGGGSVFKTLEYVQTGNNAPVPDPQGAGSAFATYSPATNQTVTAVHVTGPNGINITLSNVFNLFFASQDFPSGAVEDAAFPAGTYTITATPVGSGTLSVPAVATIPVPKISNLAALQSFDPTKDFTVLFAPFTGASAQSDSIFIDVTGSAGHHFYAPDYCVPRMLAVTATSVVIPANTFTTSDKLQGSISFSRFASNTNAIPNTGLTAGAEVTTSFDLTGGSTGSDVRWNDPTFDPASGNITLTAAVSAGHSLVVEMSTDLKTWTQVGTASPVNGIATYVTSTKTGAKAAFFRARVQ